MTSREDWENSETRYYDGILPPSKADKLIAKAEDGQTLPAGTTYRGKVDDEELVADFLSRPTSRGTGLDLGRELP